MNNKRWMFVVGIVFMICMSSIFSGSAALAAPPDSPSLAPLGTGFSYQGYLEDGGAPADGSYDLRFSLWDDPAAGSQVGVDATKLAVDIDEGQFAVELDFGNLFDGTALWLEVEAKATGAPDYTTLSPRQALSAVPYAHFALNIPDHDHWGAAWNGTGTGLSLTSSTSTGLSVESQAADGTAIYGIASGSNQSIGISGSSDGTQGQGVAGFANSSTGFARGVYGFSASSTGFGVFGFAPSTGNHGVGGESQAIEGRGVTGTAWRMDGKGVNYGVYGRSNSPDGFGGFFVNLDNSSAGVLLAANDDESTDDLEFKVSNNGNVYADGTYSSPAADFAEMLPGAGDAAPGDVLVIGLDGKLIRSSIAYQSTVLGVYSTQPGFLGGAVEGEESDLNIPLAVLGVVPVKASAENGAIRPGDLLVTSATAGYAMRGGENPPQGTVIGKAITGLDQGLGLIEMMVTIQ